MLHPFLQNSAQQNETLNLNSNRLKMLTGKSNNAFEKKSYKSSSNVMDA